MRNQLKKMVEERAQFTGTFERFGTKRGWRGQIESTILLVNIKDENGRIVEKFAWFNVGKRFKALILRKGYVVSFSAKVEKCLRENYDSYTEDCKKSSFYKLVNPTKIAVISTNVED